MKTLNEFVHDARRAQLDEFVRWKDVKGAWNRSRSAPDEDEHDERWSVGLTAGGAALGALGGAAIAPPGSKAFAARNLAPIGAALGAGAAMARPIVRRGVRFAREMISPPKTRQELRAAAKKLGIKGWYKMSKAQLADALGLSA